MPFEYSIHDDPRGVLWAFISIQKERASGLLGLEWSAGGRNFKKEVVFDKGEPIAIRSNRSQDRLLQFLKSSNAVPAKDYERLMLDKEAQATEPQIVSWLMSQGLMDGATIAEMLEAYFKERLFSSVSLVRGSVRFKDLPQIPEKAYTLEQVRLSKPFEQILWAEVKHRLDPVFCRSRFSGKMSQALKMKSEFPMMLNASELRIWKELCSHLKKPEAFSDLELQMGAVASEFGLFVWGVTPHEALKKELTEMRQKYAKASVFEILGMEESCSDADIRKAYLAFVKKYHPDRLPGGSEADLRALSEEVLAQVNEAYDILSDAEKREEYLAERALADQGGIAAVEKRLKAEMKLDEAKTYIRRKQFAQAAKILEEIESLMSDYPEFEADYCFANAMSLAEAKSQGKINFSESQVVLDKARRAMPDNVDVLYYKAVLYRVQGDIENALVYFDHVIEKAPHFSEAVTEARVLRMRQEKATDKKSGWFKKK